jgi:hypothetical protein
LFPCWYLDFSLQQYLWHRLVWSNFWPSFKFSIGSLDVHFLSLFQISQTQPTSCNCTWWYIRFLALMATFLFLPVSARVYFMQSGALAFLSTLARDL